MTDKHYKDNLYIKSVIESGKTFFIGRIAGCELLTASNFLNGNIVALQADLPILENNAGIKVTDTQSLQEYVSTLISSYDNCTVIAEWPLMGDVYKSTGTGQNLISMRTPNTPKIDACALEPYYFGLNEIWTDAIKGKRLLIIHPFVKTFRAQLENLNTIFAETVKNGTLFKDCEFEFIAPPITAAGNHDDMDWRAHYSEFIDRLNAHKGFDIALIAAGGYGMLIGDHIFTKMGKSAIYIGGALQLFFGVIGKRWFDNEYVMKLVNDNWTRPRPDDRPQNYRKIEGGCYW